jgi:hypothetical protein
MGTITPPPPPPPQPNGDGDGKGAAGRPDTTLHGDKASMPKLTLRKPPCLSSLQEGSSGV